MSMIDTNDLAVVVSLIDVSAQRGAIRGDELANVGVLRNKLVNTIQAAQAAAQEESAAEGEVRPELLMEDTDKSKTGKTSKATK